MADHLSIDQGVHEYSSLLVLEFLRDFPPEWVSIRGKRKRYVCRCMEFYYLVQKNEVWKVRVTLNPDIVRRFKLWEAMNVQSVAITQSE